MFKIKQLRSDLFNTYVVGHVTDGKAVCYCVKETGLKEETLDVGRLRTYPLESFITDVLVHFNIDAPADLEVISVPFYKWLQEYIFEKFRNESTQMPPIGQILLLTYSELHSALEEVSSLEENPTVWQYRIVHPAGVKYAVSRAECLEQLYTLEGIYSTEKLHTFFNDCNDRIGVEVNAVIEHGGELRNYLEKRYSDRSLVDIHAIEEKIFNSKIRVSKGL